MTPSRESKPRFIVIEGLDGAGTTTQTRLLAEAMHKAGLPTMATREPSDGPVGTMIRQALHKRLVVPTGNGSEPLGEATLTLLFSADRLDHNQSVIEPALNGGSWVLCDRYDYSTRAYQAQTADADAWVRSCNAKARRPDLVFFLRIEAEAALARLGARESLSIFETQNFLSKVVARYDAVLREEKNVVTLDALLPIENLHEAIKRELNRRFDLTI